MVFLEYTANNNDNNDNKQRRRLEEIFMTNHTGWVRTVGWGQTCLQAASSRERSVLKGMESSLCAAELRPWDTSRRAERALPPSPRSLK